MNFNFFCCLLASLRLCQGIDMYVDEFMQCFLVPMCNKVEFFMAFGTVFNLMSLICEL